MNQGAGVSRRNFVKLVGLSTAFSTALGKSWTNVIASEIAATASAIGILRVRIQDFPALQGNSGSVRFAINPVLGSSGPNGTYYPVTVNKGPNNTFFAVNSRCTHEGCIVEKMNTTTNLMTCNCHGSVYAIDGTRRSGPAPSSLAKYNSSFDGNDLLTIEVPNLRYTLNVTSVQPLTEGTKRLQLTFRSFRNVTYEVQFRETLGSLPVVVPFARSATEAASLTSFRATSAADLNFFVDSSTASGFYTVAIRVTTV